MNILLTAAGSPVFIPTLKSLKNNENIPNACIHTCDMNPDAIGLKMADKSFICPPGKSEDYIPTIYQYCRDNNVDLIIPAADEELLALSKNINFFNEIGCKVLVSSTESLNLVQNKYELYKNCAESSILHEIVPNFSVCNNLKTFKHSYSLISRVSEKVCIKPAVAHGSRGFRVVEKNVLSKKEFFNSKPNPKRTTFEEIQSILSQDSSDIPDLLVMEYLPGEEFSVDCFMDNEEFYCVTRSRDSIKEGICTSGTAKKNPELIKISKALYEYFGLSYSLNIQFRYDAYGNPKLLEINPRLAGTMELSRGAGVDFAKLAVDKILGFKVQENIEPVWETKMSRSWIEIFDLSDNLFTLESVSSLVRKKFYNSGRFTEKGQRKKVLVDIDETICFYPGERKYDLAEPSFNNIEKINSLFDNGWEVVYWTARGAVSGRDYTEFTREQLDYWGCKYHSLITGTGSKPKPHFDLIVDDKSKRIEEL